MNEGAGLAIEGAGRAISGEGLGADGVGFAIDLNPVSIITSQGEGMGVANGGGSSC